MRACTTPRDTRSGLLAVALFGALLSIFPTTAEALTQAEALRILGEQVLHPSANDELIAAYLAPSPLAGGTVAPGFGGSPTVDVADISGTPQWFALVDLEPCALWEHDALYVFIDDVTGVVTVFAATDWPSIDGVPLGADGELVRIIPVVSRGEGEAPQADDSPLADWGDAPDGRLAYTGVPGLFPTKFVSATGAEGAHALSVGGETFGVNVSAERGALDPADPDGVPNLVDTEDERVFLAIDLGQSPPVAHLIYDVAVPAGGEAVPRFYNLLVDFDQDGEWGGADAGAEWVVQNQPVVILPGTTSTQITPAFDWGDGASLATLAWARARLSRAIVNPAAFPDGWDGSGAFESGEVEDYKIYLRPCIIGCPLTPPPPPDEPDDDGGGDGGGEDPGPVEDWEGNPVKYFALVVRGRDNPPQTFVRGAAEKMAAFLDDQGYDVDTVYDEDADETSAIDQIQAWVDGVLPQIDCEDRILIYIGAHGADLEGGRVRLGDGTTMTSAQLGPILDKIENCAAQRCDQMMKSCHVTVLLESCHAGHWRGDDGMGGITGGGRTIITSSVAEKPALAIRGDGLYSSLWRACSSDIDADGDDDGGVSPAEAHDWVVANNMLPQGPGATSSECDCTCPIGCPGDTNDDRVVDVDDLINVILNWDTNDPGADVNGDGTVDVDDLVLVILNWGPCETCRSPDRVDPDPCLDAVLTDCQGDEELECWPVAVIAGDVGLFPLYCTCVESPDEGGGCAPVLIEDFGITCLGSCPDASLPCTLHRDGVNTGATSLATGDIQVGAIYTCDCEEEIVLGACCTKDGGCVVVSQVQCAASGGLYQGDLSGCVPNPCEPLIGACCFDDGTCQLLSAQDCAVLGGLYLGDGSSCAPGVCPGASGACCFPGGLCILTTAIECKSLGGVYQGDGSSCVPNPCEEPTGACCVPGTACFVTTASACDGDYQGDNTTCDPDPCPQPTGACCIPGAACFVTTASACDGDYQGDGTTCSPDPCPQPTGACCVPGTACFVTTASACDGDYQGDGTTCSPDPCPQPTGACCIPGTACFVTTASACDGDYQGDGTTCSPDPCPQPTGACCIPGAACFVTTASACDGDYQGDGTTCSPDPCPQPTGACCIPGAACFVTTASACDGDYQGDGTTCSPDPCPQPLGACCFEDGSCFETVAAECEAAGGLYQGGGTSCNPNPCPQPGACCFPDGSCIEVFAFECEPAGGIYQGDGTTCVPNPCLEPMGACCIPGAACTVTTAAACDGEYQGDGTTCVPDPCPQPIGACCFSDGSCLEATVAQCVALNGGYQGDGVPCEPNPCPQFGACCFPDGGCVVETEIVCLELGGAFQGPGSPCGPTQCPPTQGACCLPDGQCVEGPQDLCMESGGVFVGPGVPCRPNPCGANSCCTPSDTPGCDDPQCEQQVCAIDPFCCKTAWDEKCVMLAQKVCPGCP